MLLIAPGFVLVGAVVGQWRGLALIALLIVGVVLMEIRVVLVVWHEGWGQDREIYVALTAVLVYLSRLVGLVVLADTAVHVMHLVVRRTRLRTKATQIIADTSQLVREFSFQNFEFLRRFIIIVLTQSLIVLANYHFELGVFYSLTRL